MGLLAMYSAIVAANHITDICPNMGQITASFLLQKDVNTLFC